MNKFKVWRVIYRDREHEGGVIVKAESPEEAIKVGNKVMKREEKFNPEHFAGLEILALVWEDK